MTPTKHGPTALSAQACREVRVIAIVSLCTDRIDDIGVSLLDVVQIHHSVLVDVLRSSGGHELPDVAEAASTFLVEVLASFDMTRRAFLNPTAGADHPVDPSPHAHG